MSADKNEKPSEALAPVYIPWKSFANYVSGLKTTTIPHTLDNTVRPPGMAGGLWRQLISALQFLGFIGPDKVVQETFKKLVKNYGGAEWKSAVSTYVLPAYVKIIRELSIESATPAQLEERFKKYGNVDGQMLQKSIRFYLHALKEAGVKCSDFLAMRREKATNRRNGGGRKKRLQSPSGSEDRHNGDREERGPGKGKDRITVETVSFPIYLSDGRTGEIILPKDLNESDLTMINSMVSAVQAYAALPKEGASTKKSNR